MKSNSQGDSIGATVKAFHRANKKAAKSEKPDKAAVCVKVDTIPEETQIEYRQRVTDFVCDLLAEGKTLTSICMDNLKDVPRKNNFLKWLAADECLRNQYACAREAQADYIAEQTIDIADTETDPQVARVRIDARKWFASKVAPKKYGDKITQEHTGANGAPLDLSVNFVSPLARP